MAPIIDDNNRGPLVNVGIWISLVAACLAAGTKVCAKFALGRRLFMDDVYMLLALFLVIGTNIAISLEVQYGLGSHQSQVEQTLDSFLRAQYASEVIYVVAVYFTKLTALHFFLSLAGHGPRRKLVKASIISIFVWLPIASIVVAVQCQPPSPWLSQPGRCINQTAFWISNTAIDCITQIEIALLPIFLLHDLQSAKPKKRYAMLAFSPNILTLPLPHLRTIFYIQSLSYPTDTTWYTFNFALLTGLHVNIGLFLSSIPFSKPVIDSLILIPQVVPLESTGEGSGGLQGTLSSIFRYKKGWKRREHAASLGAKQDVRGDGETRRSRRYGNGNESGRGTVGSTLVGAGSVGGGGDGMSTLGRYDRGRGELELEEAGIDWQRGPAGGTQDAMGRVEGGGDHGVLPPGSAEGEVQSQSDRELASMESEEVFRRDGSQERMIIRRMTSEDTSSEPKTRVITRL